jgi:hypothetical protein
MNRLFPSQAETLCLQAFDTAYAESNVCRKRLEMYDGQVQQLMMALEVARNHASRAAFAYGRAEDNIAYLRMALRDEMGEHALTPSHPSADWSGHLNFSGSDDVEEDDLDLERLFSMSFEEAVSEEEVAALI